MGFPDGADTTVLTMTLGLVDGTGDRETVTITPSVSQIVSTALNDIREGTAVTVTPDRGTGKASVRLLNTDATGYNPSGWTYTIQRGDRAPYSISLPKSAGATVDLADLTPVSESPGTYDVLLPESELGGAAFLDVGTTTGTVAAGDDSRFGKVGSAVSVSGTAASGKVLTATSASAATWQTPAAGGGGASIVSQGDDRIDLEIVVLTNAQTWTVVRTSGGVAVGKSVKAAAGDRILVSTSFMYTGTQYELDLAVMASDGTSVSRYASSSGNGTTPGAEGYAPFYTQATSFPHASGPIMFTVGAGEVDGNGMFTVNLAYYGPSLSGTDQKIYAGGGYIARWTLLNIGPEPA